MKLRTIIDAKARDINMMQSCFREFILYEMASRHAKERTIERFDETAEANPDIIPNPEKLLKIATQNIAVAEAFYKGPNTPTPSFAYAIEILPRFSKMLGNSGSFDIPQTEEEAKRLPNFKRGVHGSVGDVVIAILVPPKTNIQKSERSASQLNTSTVKFHRNPEIPGIGSTPKADDKTTDAMYVKHDVFLKDAKQAARLGLILKEPVDARKECPHVSWFVEPEPSQDVAPQQDQGRLPTAAELLDVDHPNHADFIAWLKKLNKLKDGVKPSKRQARDFLKGWRK